MEGSSCGSVNQLLAALFCLCLISPLAFSATSCPKLNINAMCVNGTWQVNIIPTTMDWDIMGGNVNGASCPNNAQTNRVHWNYAFSSARLGLVGCNYRLMDQQFNPIGLIQIKSTHLKRTGGNWEQNDYPGNWTCRASQESCLFLD